MAFALVDAALLYKPIDRRITRMAAARAGTDHVGEPQSSASGAASTMGTKRHVALWARIFVVPRGGPHNSDSVRTRGNTGESGQ
jgi:hypothetical protein